MELRLKPKKWIENNSFIKFSIDNKINSKSLRLIFNEPDKLKKYYQDEIKKYKDFYDNSDE